MTFWNKSSVFNSVIDIFDSWQPEILFYFIFNGLHGSHDLHWVRFSAISGSSFSFHFLDFSNQWWIMNKHYDELLYNGIRPKQCELVWCCRKINLVSLIYDNDCSTVFWFFFVFFFHSRSKRGDLLDFWGLAPSISLGKVPWKLR